MANPAIVACAADTWVKVATAVTSAKIWIYNFGGNVVVHTYRLTTGAAPTDQSESIPVKDRFLDFTASAPSDVYIYSKGGDSSVRVDA